VYLLNFLKGTTAIPVKFLDGSPPIKFMALEYIYDAVPITLFPLRPVGPVGPGGPGDPCKQIDY